MGEAKRRGDPADKLPDFIFVRDEAVENQGGLLLAGNLVTDIPKAEKPSESDQHLMNDIIQRLLDEVRSDPEISEADFWRNGEPAAALDPPFPRAMMRARMKRCAIVAVRIDSGHDGRIRMDECPPDEAIRKALEKSIVASSHPGEPVPDQLVKYMQEMMREKTVN